MKTIQAKDLSKILEVVYSDPSKAFTPREADAVLLDALVQTMEGKPKIIGPTGPTHSSTVIDLGNGAELWLSEFGYLATIFCESNIPDDIRNMVISTLEQNHWKYVPEILANSKISEDNYCSWFDALFGYY